MRVKETPIKFCQYCGKKLERKRLPNGDLEYFIHFNKRKYCDRECMKRAFLKPDKDKKVHKVDKLRGVWATMKSRCYLKTNEKFSNYGKRGIVVCDEWKTNFKAFKSWAVENGYQEGLTLDRIDVNGNYCPSNCRWVTNKVQQNNRTNNRIVEYKGEKYTLKQLSEKARLPYSTLWNRLNLGWSVEEAVESPRLFMHNKEVQNGR